MNRRDAMLAALLPGAWLGSALAQFPERPVRIIVPFQVGGASDAAARALADALSKKTGQPFMVENRPGATGLLGTQAAASAMPDGYTLMMGHTDTLSLAPLLRRKLPYDASRAFEPVAFVGRVSGLLIARPGAGIDSGEALVRAAKQRPGRVSLASWGIGSTPHLGLELMNHLAGIELLHVPFQGTTAAVQALLGGQVDLAWVTPEFAAGVARDGKAVIVGASSRMRIARAPQVRTLSEQGFHGFDLDTWYGLVAPPGTPRPIRERLHAWVNEVLGERDTAERLRAAGHETQVLSLAEFEAFMARDRERWSELMRVRRLAIELD
jgi:tripartite-type tricarboxylate transporter receptor subunit TctC